MSSSPAVTPDRSAPGGQRIRVLYFAWVRERVGRAEEVLDVPSSVTSVADLVAWLRQRGPEYADAFERPEIVRAAIDQTHVRPAAAIAGAREVAFFPPVTGG